MLLIINQVRVGSGLVPMCKCKKPITEKLAAFCFKSAIIFNGQY
jgi:hypothetical protein